MSTHTAVRLCLKEDDLYRLPVDPLLLTVSLPENKAACDLRIHTRHYPGAEVCLNTATVVSFFISAAIRTSAVFVLLRAGFYGGTLLVFYVPYFRLYSDGHQTHTTNG